MFRLLHTTCLIALAAGLGPARAQTLPATPQATAAPQAPARPARPTPPTRDPHTPGYVEAKQLPDGDNAPTNQDGNFILGPTHTAAPEMSVQEGVPQGAIFDFTMASTDSKIYPGIAREQGTFGTPDPENPGETDRHHQPSRALHAPRRRLRAQAICARHRRALHRRRRRTRPLAVHSARQPDRAKNACP